MWCDIVGEPEATKISAYTALPGQAPAPLFENQDGRSFRP